MVETTSNESSISVPSTESQLGFAKKLADELTDIGLSDVSVDENGYVVEKTREFLQNFVDAYLDHFKMITGKN